MPDKIKPFTPSTFDNLIGLISPKFRENRIRSKLKARKMLRRFDGAGSGRRSENWLTNSGSANNIIGTSLRKLRDRARDLRINNENATSGISTITTYMVGGGIKTKFKAIGDPKDRAAQERAKMFNDLWKAWAETTACDFAGRHNIFGLQRIVSDAIPESGEIIVRFRRVRPTLENPLGLQLQLLESDHLESNFLRQKLQNGNFLLQGIEFDKNGKRVAYHLFERHPGGPSSFGEVNLKTVQIPARDVLHPYREDRPGQVRGVTWLAPVMVKMRDYGEYEDATLVRQKIANCFSVFITDPNGDADGIGGSNSEQKDADDDLDGEIAPGSKVTLPAGKSIELANPPGVELSHRDYSSVSLHAIAAGLDVPYELLSKDVSQANYSSIRAVLNSFMKKIRQWRSDFFYPQFMDPIAFEFLRMSILLGFDPTGITFSHKPPAVQILDPTKEVPALKTEVRSGFKSWSDAVEELGQDPEELIAQISLDNQNFDRLNIVLDSDPRQTQNNGSMQSDGTDSTVPDDDTETETSRRLQ